MSTKKISVDVVIPVFNEADVLERNIVILQDFLSKNSDFLWKIVIADNGSTDSTPYIAQKLASQNYAITYLHVPVKGRGLALRTAWLESQADIVSYMDADLSTNINYFPLLIEGIKCGYDVAIGSRLMGTSRVRRRLKREIVSRTFNAIIKILFLNKFSDAQCGFKALKREVAQKVLPEVRNNNWFFDTELLLLTESLKYRIFEVPVEWTDDLTTKVRIFETVIEDILGLLRVRFSMRKNKTDVNK
ncbi:MAG: glycosyltransferase [Candidatus Omnitrophica bacterium]|nr:glycosyltransferase [Candidatus Omnitrophota bacterium]